ncbi:putative ankyrin repeat protein RF_0381 [Aplysia californica]|uniref:Ankyrin repeat protein RF_0381 n=1 Tax=Aplysia californica TaxID=6500 RepID=A0ABM1W427_APLCA|nr:putative ankyrin repeat protein RF_0381 [Aplysia californica]
MSSKAVVNPALGEFFTAVRFSNCKKIKKMLKDRVVDVEDVDLSDSCRPTAIIVASELGLLEVVKTLMRAKPKPADVNAETRKGRRAIWWAAKSSNLELAQLLVSEKKCEVNYVDKETGCTPLYRAIISNCAPVARELVHAGADVNIRRLGFDIGAETPLIKSVQLNNLEICDLLVNSMCKIHAKTEEGLTALHFSIAYRRYEICEYLLKSGIKVNACSNHGVTAMTVAIEQHNPYMVRLLVQFGYKLNKPYKWSETPLEQAIKIHSQECALTLLHWGCSRKRKRKQTSYFYLAVNEKQWSIVRFLTHLNPMYLQETWIRAAKWPVSIYHRPDAREYLLNAAKEVWTLKQYCRAVVFNTIGKYAPVKIDKLPLPPVLKEYLKFNEFVKEDFYIQEPLEKVECPFDCPTICPQRNCPELDISISSDTDSEFEI